MQCIAESFKNGARTGATHRQYRIHIKESSPPETQKRSISWRYRQNPKSRLYIELGHVNRRRGRLNHCNCVLNRRVCYRCYSCHKPRCFQKATLPGPLHAASRNSFMPETLLAPSWYEKCLQELRRRTWQTVTWLTPQLTRSRANV